MLTSLECPVYIGEGFYVWDNVSLVGFLKNIAESLFVKSVNVHNTHQISLPLALFKSEQMERWGSGGYFLVPNPTNFYNGGP